MDCIQFLKDHQVTINNNPLNLGSVPKPSTETIQKAEKDLDFEFCKDYIAFCTQIGGGHLSQINIFTPLEKLTPHSLQFQTNRFRQNISKKTLKYKFSWDSVIIFAQDITETVFFGWKNNQDKIYLLSDSGDHPMPPQVVCDDFKTFLIDFCLGDALREAMMDYLEDEDSEDYAEEKDLSFVPFPDFSQ
jgi:hypothetical protein